MKKILVKNQVEGGQVAFDLLKESLAAGAQTLGLATGSSPIALYQEMVESNVDFSELYSVNLDEYVGLAPDHEQSYHAFMKAQLFDAKPFKESFLPDGMAEDLEQAAKDYDDVLAHHASQLEHYLLSYDKFPLETKLYTNPQKLLNQLTPDIHCVFLDINMPGINGIDIAQKIRKFNPFIPIIFVTSYRDYMEQVFEVQTFDYIVKPIEPQKLTKVFDVFGV